MSEGNNNLYKFQEWLEGKIRADGSMTVHYWLVKSATIPRDANALPTTETVRKDAEKAINTYLKKQ